MHVLLIGAGGREHALAWKLSRSPRLTRLSCAPGNAGTARVATNVPVRVDDAADVARFCEAQAVDMVVVGPEVPLVAGLCDRLAAALPHLKLVGPGAAGAQLEGSKAFSKAFMTEQAIPTARYEAFDASRADAAKAFVGTLHPPYVLKADGLAAGKGVVIAHSLAEAEATLDEMFGGKFGAAGATVVVEEFLSGPEFSVFALTDGTDYQLLPVARDYKRAGEGDTGPNTGGMGAVSPVPFADKHMMLKVRQRVVEPTLRGLRERGIPYAGFLFLGLINVGGEPYVIEYNCRLGDPETQAIVPRITTDLLEHLESLFDGTLGDKEIGVDARAAATLVLASGGYPEAYETGKAITGLGDVADSIPFLAGVRREGEGLVTDGGRVLALTSYGLTYMEAAETCRRSAKLVQFDKAFWRRDIGEV